MSLTKRKKIRAVCLIILFILSGRSFFQPRPLFSQLPSETPLLKLLNITPLPESLDYIQNRTQFFQEQLTTERKHPQTLNISQKIEEDIQSGISQSLSVEADIEKKLTELARTPHQLNRLVGAIERAILGGDRIYIYGSGASGHLAVQMESTFWRPFWNRIAAEDKIWAKLSALTSPAIASRLTGDMTGGDRALLGSMDSLEDLMLMGWLQLQERGIRKGDVVICVAESGETPAVIGTLQAALDLWKNAPAYQPGEACQKLFFIHNNPERELLLFDRCRGLMEEPGITRIDLTTGPQSITGSTRLQASTINTFVLGHVLQAALYRSLQRFLTKKEMARIGFVDGFDLPEMLLEYSSNLNELKERLPFLAEMTRLETHVLAGGGSITYHGRRAFLSILNDLSGRIPDFHLFPFDTVEVKEPHSSYRLWTEASGKEEAWEAALGRPFRGLNPAYYMKPIEEVVADPYLKQTALDALKDSGPDQSSLYDFSMTARTLTRAGPSAGDMGISVLISPEDPDPGNGEATLASFIRLFSGEQRHLAILWITDKPEKEIEKALNDCLEFPAASIDVFFPFRSESIGDPLGVNRQVALKLILNSHSSAVMAGLGKIWGNSLSHIKPVNFKLIGRATHLLQSIVNDTLSSPKWVERYGIKKPIAFGEANAVLFSSNRYLSEIRTSPLRTSEVSLSVIQILESLRSQAGMSLGEALSLSEKTGLNRYLANILN